MASCLNITYFLLLKNIYVRSNNDNCMILVFILVFIVTSIGSVINYNYLFDYLNSDICVIVGLVLM